jgi:MoaA/NifB/PqqE/SkfB family radical SAM enzyme
VHTHLPPRLQVELTNACPLSCSSCARNYWDEASNADAHMSEATLAALAPLFDAAMEVTYGGYGDPTTSPLLGRAVRQAKAAGAAVRVITGGASLTSARIRELCDLGLDRLVLSMDGARDDTLRELRGLPMSAFLGWLRAVREARTPGSMRPLVQLNFVAQRDNVHELPELVELCDREDIAGIHVFHLNVYENSLRDRSLLTNPGTARPWFEQAGRDAARLGVFLHLPPLDGQARSCRQPFEHLFIRHDGRVRGCCSAAFEPGLYGLEVGDLSQDPADLWRAPILEQFRAASEAGRDEDLPKPCRNCSFRLPTLESHLRPLAKLPTLIGEHRVGT